MIILGLRCTTSEFSYSVVEGTQKNYSYKDSKRIKFPTGYSHCELLMWFYNEIEGLINQFNVNQIGVKGTEPMSMKGKSYGARMELEAMIFLQAIQKGFSARRKVKGTIAKDLGLKGRGKYLADGFDYSGIPNFAKMSSQLQEATQVALSML